MMAYEAYMSRITTEASPQFDRIFYAVPDLNAIPRGKVIFAPPNSKNNTDSVASTAEKAIKKKVALAYSALNIDISGLDSQNNPLIFTQGDKDGFLQCFSKNLIPMPWLCGSALAPSMMFHPDGRPYLGDARQALISVLAEFQALGFNVQAATEEEFYLFDAQSETPQPPLDSVTKRCPKGQGLLSLSAVMDHSAFIDALYQSALKMNIPLSGLVSEGGPGQFEVNFHHQSALEAVDSCWYFRLLVKGLAKKFNMQASFVSKPYHNEAGSGRHFHISLIDRKNQKNAFNDGTEKGSTLLLKCLAGCLNTMEKAFLILVPYPNCSLRFAVNSHAPLKADWGYDNRLVSIRIPKSEPEQRRFEYRAASGASNPYLVMLMILGSALQGIKDDRQPPPAVDPNTKNHEAKQPFNTDFKAILKNFRNHAPKLSFIPKEISEYFYLTKQQEQDSMQNMSNQSICNLLIEKL